MVPGDPSPATNTSAPLLAGCVGVQCPLDVFRVSSCYVASTENAGQLYLPVFQMFLGPDSGLFDVLPLDATSTYRYGLGLHEEYSSTLVWQTSVSFVRMCFLLKIINVWRGCAFLFPMMRYSRKVANSPKMRRRAKIRRTGLVHWLAEKKMGGNEICQDIFAWIIQQMIQRLVFRLPRQKKMHVRRI